MQVDFSQSVHHLWKQYRRHGKAGGMEEMAAANEQGEKERGGPRGALPGGLQLKPGAGGLYAGPSGESSFLSTMNSHEPAKSPEVRRRCYAQPMLM